MIRTIIFLFAFLASLELFAVHHLELEGDAFNRAFPATFKKSAVFSPVSFETDCAIVAESLQTIPKANVSEKMGVTVDFPSTYQPIIEAYESARTNGLKVVAARGFCVPDIRKSSSAHRQYLERTYGVEVLRSYPAQGAESWFRATMEGEMESFELAPSVVKSDRYAFYDLISVEPSFLEPFPVANTRKMKGVDCLSDVRLVEMAEMSKFSILRLPLKDDAFFYALLPKGETSLETLRGEIGNVVGLALIKTPCAIVLPKLSLKTRIDLLPLMRASQVPTKGLNMVTGEVSAKEYAQEVRFRLAENGSWEQPLREKDPKDVVPLTSEVKRLVMTRPFVFFVYHEPTGTILVAGQYGGN